MIDKTSQFFAILTAVGEAKHANAIAMGLDWMFTEMGLGDANGTDPIPDRLQTQLIHEWRRAPINQIRVDPANPNTVITEQIIPPEVGGEWIREIGLYDVDGDLVAVANCAPSYKPLLAQGTGKTQVVRMNFIVSSSANIVLKIDPAVVLATREYVDTAISEALAKLDHKQSARVAATAPIILSNVQTIDDVAVVIGDRVLVTAQEEAEDNGLYVVSIEGWTRATDADNSLEVTPGLFIQVEQGTVNGDSLWQLVTDAPITLGTTGLQFELIAGGSGVGVGTFRSVTVDALGRVVAGTNPTTLDGYGITDALPVDGTAVAAAQLETARTLSITGAASGSVLFDGTTDADIELALADSGVTAGTYSSVTVNAQGVVTAGDQLTPEDLGLGTAALANVQTHVADATAEALMKVGAFGLGGTGIILPPDTNLDTVNLGGLYRINTGGGIPAGFEYGSMLVIRAADTIAQLIVNHATGTIVSRGGSNLVDGQVPAFNPWVTSWNTSNFNPAAYQPNLGFTPVQQGTGHGQLGNIVKIGWGSDGQLRCTVDDLDLGVVWCQNNLDPALQAMPIGAPIAWPTPWPPVNYLPMMGQGFDVNLHPALAALYPGVLPDMRGEWIRGWDNGRGVDPGRNLLTFQGAVDNYLAEVKGTGSVPGVPEQGTIYVPNDGNYSASLFSGSTTGTQMSLQFKNSGGGEGRPRNMAFNIICRVY